MIPLAFALGVACLAMVIYEAATKPGDPHARMRAPIAGAWAAAFLAYGANLPGFPQPTASTIGILALTCVGTLLMMPGVRPARTPLEVHGTLDALPGYRSLLFAVALALAAWDLYFIVARVTDDGLRGLMQHRIDRGEKTGAYSLPGMEVLHAVAAAAGALGYADWLRSGRRLSLASAVLGLLTALFSSGRWDVVAYVIWLSCIHVYMRPRLGLRALVLQAVVFASLAVFFAAHGELLGKIDIASTLANSSQAERSSQAAADLPMVRSGGLRTQSMHPGAAGSGAPPYQHSVTCPRWEQGVTQANAGFRDLSRITRVFTLYLAGPFATLDRALCEERLAGRTVLMYWPHKLLRIAGLRPPEFLMVVDPFLDIGIPFNNYTAIYPFLSEVGPRAGPVAWIMMGLAVGLASIWALSRAETAWIVAGTATAAMAIRTPWGNTFFDGTLVVWIVVASLPIFLRWVADRTAL